MTKEFIQTYTGKAFYFEDPTDEQIDLKDIAHALSLVCRFGGHIKEFYSVAEHSVRCSWKAPEELQLEALLHDASEAYLVDVPRPIKNTLPQYKELEIIVEKAVARKFKTSFPMHPTIKDIDNRMLLTEKRDLMLPSEIKWLATYDFKPYDDIEIKPWDPKTAERIFLSRFYALTNKEKEAA